MTIKYPNQINQIPIIPNDQPKPRYLNRLIDRSTILSKDPKIQIPTFYGPGQSPDAGEPNLYKPPIDWSIPNSLLTMPQVVWLYLGKGLTTITNQQFYPVIATSPLRVNNPDFFADANNQTWRIELFQNGGIGAVALSSASIGGISPYVNSLGTWVRAPSVDRPPNYQGDGAPAQTGYSFSVGTVGPLFGPDDVYLSPPLPPQNLIDAYTNEYNRLKSIYQEAQMILTKLRPGRTWINIIDPWNYNDSVGDVPGIYFGDPDNTEGPYSLSSAKPIYFPNQPVLYWPMLTPSITDPYLGIDFLYIFTGTPDTTEIHITTDFNDPSVEFNEYTWVQVAKTRSIANIGNVQNFRRYSFRYYGIDIILPQFSHYTLGSVSPPSYTINITGLGTQTVYLTEVLARASGNTAPCYWVPLSGGTITYATECANNQTSSNTSIDDLNDFTNMSQQNCINQLITDARDLTGLGIDAQYVGGTPAIDSTTTLIKIIANHYNFDPDTGKDL